jgi:hypothetical protein
MQWSRRHTTAAWVLTAVAAALIWIGVRDTPVARYTPSSPLVPALLVITAVTLGMLLSHRRRRRRGSLPRA